MNGPMRQKGKVMVATGNKKKLLMKHIPEMSAMAAIYGRHSVRAYKAQEVSRDEINTLLSAAVHAPTAIHEEPWSFVVIQDRDLLKQLSDSAKASIDASAHKHLFELARDPEFNIFYNAGTLIVIYGKPLGTFVAADCWLAAENLMLAACAMGLGTCVMGMAVQVLDTPEWKKKLGVPMDMIAYAPIIVGIPEGNTQPVPRKEPDIILWK